MRGRAQPVGSKVLTPDGWRPIGELEVGDLVVGSDGEPTPVLGVYPQGEKKIYRLSSQDGASVLASEDHLWTVRDGRDGPWRVLETKELAGDLGPAGARRWELPLLTAPVRFPEREVPMDPYALGLLLGEGRGAALQTASRFASRSLGAPVAAGRSGGATTLARPPAELGLADLGPEAAYVPEAYLRNTPEIRLALLQGLLDAAGAVTADGLRFTTASERLRGDVVTLVRSLGGVARQAAGGLDVHLPEGVEPFRQAGKAAAYRAHGGVRPERRIEHIEPSGTAECVCIQVAAEDSLYVTEGFLLTHNTLNDAFIILDEAQNSSAEQMKMFLTRLGFNSKIVVTGDVTQVDLPAGTVSGLRVVQEILEGIPDIHFARLTSTDVVRHKLVSEIVDAYGRYDASQAAQEPKAIQQRGKRRP
ncbi:PhoH family protein [Nonomuraea sp. NPDC049309]|uniref:PhoH family protein n=1 Tax=Nonomuraea sp. NPDC049309 TaxID=3364350 RepID=UPI0037167773